MTEKQYRERLEQKIAWCKDLLDRELANEDISFRHKTNLAKFLYKVCDMEMLFARNTKSLTDKVMFWRKSKREVMIDNLRLYIFSKI